MSEVYEIDGYEVVFTPWHSEYLDEGFVSIKAMRDGCEVFHAGMTHAVPSDDEARMTVELVKALQETEWNNK